MGDFPLMTKNGTFIINGAERVVVSQLVRSPGVYFNSQIVNGKEMFSEILSPTEAPGSSLGMPMIFSGSESIDRKLPVTVLLRAVGYSTPTTLWNFMPVTAVSLTP